MNKNALMVYLNHQRVTNEFLLPIVYRLWWDIYSTKVEWRVYFDVMSALERQAHEHEVGAHSYQQTNDSNHVPKPGAVDDDNVRATSDAMLKAVANMLEVSISFPALQPEDTMLILYQNGIINGEGMREYVKTAFGLSDAHTTGADFRAH